MGVAVGRPVGGTGGRGIAATVGRLLRGMAEMGVPVGRLVGGRAAGGGSRKLGPSTKEEQDDDATAERTSEAASEEAASAEAATVASWAASFASVGLAASHASFASRRSCCLCAVVACCAARLDSRFFSFLSASFCASCKFASTSIIPRSVRSSASRCSSKRLASCARFRSASNCSAAST